MPYVIKPHRKGDGFVINGSSGEILSKYDLVFLRGGRWYKANASVVDTLPALGLTLNEFPTVEYRGLILLYGLVSNLAWTWNDGPIYASTTSGNMTQTAPSAEGWLQFVGVAYGKDYMLFAPMWIKEIGGVEWRFSLKHLSDGTTPVDIKSEAVRPGWKRTVRFVSVESDAPADMTFRIGYIDQLDEIGWYTEQRGKQVAGVLYGVTGPVVLQAGDRLLIRFTDSEDGNNLSIYAEGFEQKGA